MTTIDERTFPCKSVDCPGCVEVGKCLNPYVEKRPLWLLRLECKVLDLALLLMPMGYLWRHAGQWPNPTWQGRLWQALAGRSYGTWELWRMKKNGMV